MRDQLEKLVLAGAPNVRIAGLAANRLPNIATLLVDGASIDALLTALDLAGVEVSGGSACSSGAVRESHVIVAIGENPRTTAMLRCSLGRMTTANEVTQAAARIVTAIKFP
jgi:cysteine desulfurase